jgi:hypothetical protein
MAQSSSEMTVAIVRRFFRLPSPASQPSARKNGTPNMTPVAR